MLNAKLTCDGRWEGVCKRALKSVKSRRACSCQRNALTARLAAGQRRNEGDSTHGDGLSEGIQLHHREGLGVGKVLGLVMRWWRGQSRKWSGYICRI